MATREELFAQYEAAVVLTYDPLTSDELGWNSPALFSAMRDQACVVMTAWNPGFQQPGITVNEASNERMLMRLQDLGFELWPAENAAMAGHFVEPGFVVWGIPVEQAVLIAAEFGQFAIYAFTSEGVRTVVSC